MQNIELIRSFENLENELMQTIDKAKFYSGVDLNSENDVVNQFLSRYIELKASCLKEIKELKRGLNNKNIIITGGSSGIGRQVTLLCKMLGANAYVLDIKDPKLDGITWLNVDVTDKVKISQTVAKIETVDYLVSSAGLFGFDQAMTKKERDLLFTVNVYGTQNVIDACFDKLKQSQGGICCVTSGLCKTLDPTCLTYCISKQEIMKIVNKYRNKGVKMNTVLPGPILTPLLVKDVPTLVELANYCSLNPEKYCGCPEHIALGIVSIILKNENNKDLAIDGGESEMFKKQDNQYWVEGYKGPYSIEVNNKKYTWNLDSSYGVCNENKTK